MVSALLKGRTWLTMGCRMLRLISFVTRCKVLLLGRTNRKWQRMLSWCVCSCRAKSSMSRVSPMTGLVLVRLVRVGLGALVTLMMALLCCSIRSEWVATLLFRALRMMLIGTFVRCLMKLLS